MRSTSASILSPALRNLPSAAPTPSGVPVAMTSPGRTVKPLREHRDALVDRKDHLRGMARLPRLAVDPHGHRISAWGSGISSAVTSTGPIGQKVSIVLAP